MKEHTRPPVKGEEGYGLYAWLCEQDAIIPKDRLEQMQAHLDAGGTFGSNIVQELLNHIKAA